MRDAVLLTRPGDDVGPAGRMLLGWRRLATRPVEDLLSERNLPAVLEEFGHAHDDEAVRDLVDDVRRLCNNAGMAGVLTGAFAAAERYRLGRAVGSWFADALLAQRLGWIHAIPLLVAEVGARVGANRPRRSGTTIADAGIAGDADRAKDLLGAQARAALRAIDLSAELGRRSERLLAVAPKLRARASDLVIDIRRRAGRFRTDRRHERARHAPPVRPAGRARRGAGTVGPANVPYIRAVSTMLESAAKRQRGQGGDGRPNDQLFDRDLEHLPPEARWREWMNRVEATIFAASEPVGRETLARIVSKNCSIDLLIEDIREELRGRPYDLVPVAGG